MFDNELFKNDIIKKRKDERQSMDVTCKVIGISKATLSRLEKGSVPDIKTFVTVCKWLNNQSSKYLN
jgi:transcriptional regulator with XRE-family HTH domain